MKNYKVGKKLAISYITIMFLLILGSIVNIRNLIEVGERVESLSLIHIFPHIEVSCYA